MARPGMTRPGPALGNLISLCGVAVTHRNPLSGGFLERGCAANTIVQNKLPFSTPVFPKSLKYVTSPLQKGTMALYYPYIRSRQGQTLCYNLCSPMEDRLTGHMLCNGIQARPIWNSVICMGHDLMHMR